MVISGQLRQKGQISMSDEECDEYHDELIAERRRRRGEGWRNPTEDEEEEE